MFWNLWWIGVAITVVTRIIINILTDGYGAIDNRSIPVRIVMHLLVITCIVLVGGIANANFLGDYGSFSNVESTVEYIAVAIIPAVITYLVCYGVLGLDYFENTFSHLIFIVVFIISIIVWTPPCVEYYTEYKSKVETTTESNVIIADEERELTYFYGIPVQHVSGSVNASFLGGVNGSISTTDYIPYWYVSGEEGLADKAPTNESKMLPCKEGEVPYVKITTYCNRKKTVNGNTGKVSYKVTSEWSVYEFYLPEEIVKGQFEN